MGGTNESKSAKGLQATFLSTLDAVAQGDEKQSKDKEKKGRKSKDTRTEEDANGLQKKGVHKNNATVDDFGIPELLENRFLAPFRAGLKQIAADMSPACKAAAEVLWGGDSDNETAQTREQIAKVGTRIFKAQEKQRAEDFQRVDSVLSSLAFGAQTDSGGGSASPERAHGNPDFNKHPWNPDFKRFPVTPIQYLQGGVEAIALVPDHAKAGYPFSPFAKCFATFSKVNYGDYSGMNVYRSEAAPVQLGGAMGEQSKLWILTTDKNGNYLRVIRDFIETGKAPTSVIIPGLTPQFIEQHAPPGPPVNANAQDLVQPRTSPRKKSNASPSAKRKTTSSSSDALSSNASPTKSAKSSTKSQSTATPTKGASHNKAESKSGGTSSSSSSSSKGSGTSSKSSSTARGKSATSSPAPAKTEVIQVSDSEVSSSSSSEDDSDGSMQLSE